MIWLTIADGLPIGAWRQRCIGQSGTCTLCNLQVLQTSEHALFACQSVTEAWSRLRHINTLAQRPPGLARWEDALYGDLGRPLPPGRQGSTEEEHLWEGGKSCRISKETPFYIIRCGMIWYIWCQHTEHDLHSGIFHLGVAIYRAWQMTVQVGMAAWAELQKYKRKRNPLKHAAMEDLFLQIWTQGQLFCTAPDGRPRWKPTPHPEFFAENLANRYSSARIFREGAPLGNTDGFRQNPAEDLACASEGDLSPPLLLAHAEDHASSEAEDVAEAIIDRIIFDLHGELQAEQGYSQDTDEVDSLPDDLQEPADLDSQARFWTAS